MVPGDFGRAQNVLEGVINAQDLRGDAVRVQDIVGRA